MYSIVYSKDEVLSQNLLWKAVKLQDKKKGDKNDRCPKGTATTETSKVQENRMLTKQNETGIKKRKLYISKLYFKGTIDILNTIWIERNWEHKDMKIFLLKNELPFWKGSKFN